MKKFFFPMLTVSLILLIGCSNQVRVSGKVTFDDGSPVTAGKVIFENDAFFQAVGQIKPDGTYRLGSYDLADGVPRGNYKVYITGAVSAEERSVSTRAQTGEKSMGKSSVSMPVFTKLIHSKYEKPETSGLTCDVKKSTIYDIKVERP